MMSCNIDKTGDGTVLCNYGSNCNLHFYLVCITDCKASSRGGAFYYNTPSHTVNPSFEYMTINNCHCNERVIYSVGNFVSDMSLSILPDAFSEQPGSKQV